MTPTKKWILCLLIALMVSGAVSGCAAKPEENGAVGDSATQTITISGAFALYPMMVRWSEEYQKLHPEIQFDISAGGAGKGMADALSGMVDIGMVSRDIKSEEIEQGAFWVAVTKDAVFPTISAQNPVLDELLAKGVSQELFAGIFIGGDITTWGQVVGETDIEDSIHVYTRSDSCGAADIWGKYLGGAQEDLLGIGVSGDPGLMEAVMKDPLGIGYNNLNYAFDPATGLPVSGAAIIPIDVNGNGIVDDSEYLADRAKAIEAVKNGDYPSPPSRLLNLVTKGKPDGVVMDFINWILGDGQSLLVENGYIPLTEDQLVEETGKIK